MGSFVQLLTVANVAALTALDGTTSPRRAANVVIWVINDGAGTPAEYMFADGAGSGTVEADDSAGYWNRLESSVVADGAITTAKIASDAVTTAKIANNAVTLAKIATQADNTITANLSGGVASPSAVAIQSFVASLLQSANVTAAQQSLDLETGVDVQAYSAILAAMVSGYGAATSGDVFKKDGSNGAWAAEAGGGASTFAGLTDTPANYTSSGGYAVRVNSGATALEFAAFNAALVGLGNVPNTDCTDASNLSSGTLADARLSASVTTSLGLADSALQAGDQIDADDVTTGTLADARLSSAVTTSLGLADTGLQPGDQLDADDVTTGTLPNARLDAVPLTALATQVDNTILANFSGGTAVPSAVTVAAHIETFLESADAAAARTAIGADTGGGPVQQVRTENDTRTSGSTTTPYDDTIPQNTEGTEFLTQAITPISGSNYLEIEVYAWLSEVSNTGNHLTGALFVDSAANAISAGFMVGQAGSSGLTGGLFHLKHRLLASSTSARTYKFRAGMDGGATEINGAAGGRKYGGVMTSFIDIREVEP